MSLVHDLTGLQFGKLTVVSRGPNTRHNKPTWNVECSCGGTKTVSAAHLKNGTTKSCGCSRQEFMLYAGEVRRRNRPAGQSAITELIGRYSNRANQANRKFKLTREQFISIVTSNCHYCGIVPVQLVWNNWKSRYNEGFTYNGIDRKENNKGYTVSNSLPCCAVCNYAKSSMTYDEFLNYLSRVVVFRGSNAA